jgi:hypothetical protein
MKHHEWECEICRSKVRCYARRLPEGTPALVTMSTQLYRRSPTKRSGSGRRPDLNRCRTVRVCEGCFRQAIEDFRSTGFQTDQAYLLARAVIRAMVDCCDAVSARAARANRETAA